MPDDNAVCGIGSGRDSAQLIGRNLMYIMGYLARTRQERTIFSKLLVLMLKEERNAHEWVSRRRGKGEQSRKCLLSRNQ